MELWAFFRLEPLLRDFDILTAFFGPISSPFSLYEPKRDEVKSCLCESNKSESRVLFLEKSTPNFQVCEILLLETLLTDLEEVWDSVILLFTQEFYEEFIVFLNLEFLDLSNDFIGFCCK